jgi:hypothetical protein
MNSSTSSSEDRGGGGQARVYFAALIAILTLMIGGTALSVFIIDPLQVFRAATLYEPVIIKDERTQNAGLLRNYPAESLIIGSSISQACRADEFERLIGGEFLRISSAGLTARELALYLNVRMKRMRPTRVYDIEYWYTFARENAAGFREEYGEFPEHLYRMSLLESAKYLINFDNISMTREIVAEMAGLGSVERTPFELRNSPEIEPQRAKGRASVMKLYRQIAGGRKPNVAFIKAERDRMVQTFSTVYEPVIEANPDVEFHIVLPPASLAYYQAFNKSGIYRLNTILLFRSMVSDLEERQANVVVHDLAVDEATLIDLDKFFDTHHFSEAVCTEMAAKIAADPDGDDAATIKANTARLRRWIAKARPPA